MTLAYSDVGRGPTMMFFHNAGSNRDLWSKQVEHYSSRFRCVTLDLPGYGLGEEIHGDATLPRYARFVSAAVRELSQGEPPILVGHCIGAAMVLAATLEDPGLARSLVLFNVATYTGIKTGGYGPLLRLLRRAPFLSAPAQWLTARAPTAVRKASLRSQYLRTESDPYLDVLAAVNGAPKHAASLASLAGGMQSYQALETFEKPKGFPPTLLMWGRSNKVLPIASASAVRASLTPSAYHVLEAGHLSMREAATVAHRHMDAFLSQAATSSSAVMSDCAT